MFTAKVYRMMIGSLSGSMEEVYAAKEIVREWNQQNAEDTGKIYLPIEWTTKQGEIKNLDVVIGIAGNWIEKTALIEGFVKEGKKVLLFFNTFQDPKNTIQSEYDEVKAFRSRMQDNCLCADFTDKKDLCAILNEHLSVLQ